MEADDQAMKKKKRTTKKATIKTGERGLPLWPKGKAVPKFKSPQEEAEWWESNDLAAPVESAWEAVEYHPRETHKAREHVYRVRLNDEEMATLQMLAKRRGVTASIVIRELVRAQAPR